MRREVVDVVGVTKDWSVVDLVGYKRSLSPALLKRRPFENSLIRASFTLTLSSNKVYVCYSGPPKVEEALQYVAG
jgi:hypothetical protein